MPKTTRQQLQVTTSEKTKAIAKSPASKQKTINRSDSIKVDKPVKITKEILKRLSKFHKETCARQNLDDIDTFKYAGAIDGDAKKTPKTPATAISSVSKNDITDFETASTSSFTRRSFP